MLQRRWRWTESWPQLFTLRQESCKSNELHRWKRNSRCTGLHLLMITPLVHRWTDWDELRSMNKTINWKISKADANSSQLRIPIYCNTQYLTLTVHYDKISLFITTKRNFHFGLKSLRAILPVAIKFPFLLSIGSMRLAESFEYNGQFLGKTAPGDIFSDYTPVRSHRTQKRTWFNWNGGVCNPMAYRRCWIRPGRFLRYYSTLGMSYFWQ